MCFCPEEVDREIQIVVDADTNGIRTDEDVRNRALAGLALKIALDVVAILHLIQSTVRGQNQAE